MDWIIIPFQRTSDFTGRSGRKEYWLFVLFSLLVAIICFVGFLAAGGFSSETFEILAEKKALAWTIGGIYFLIFVLPSIALGIRRWHDLGYTGWMYLLFLILGAIPIVGVLFNIGNFIWFCMPGTAGQNKYGDDPLDAPYPAYIP